MKASLRAIERSYAGDDFGFYNSIGLRRGQCLGICARWRARRRIDSLFASRRARRPGCFAGMTSSFRPSAPQLEKARRLLCALQDEIQATLIAARARQGKNFARVAAVTAED